MTLQKTLNSEHDLNKIIIYICPGHQLSEFVPWLINHSPEMDHNRIFENKHWTHYKSSYGEGYEPIESHWTLPDGKLTRLYQTIGRSSSNFPVELFDTLLEYWIERKQFGTKCLYFNLMPDDYTIWTNECKTWFAKHDIDFVLAGHTLYIDKMENPSRFFIKEGYIIDANLCTRDAFDDVQFIKRKTHARGNRLFELYQTCKFDVVWNIEQIQNINSCREMIATLVEPPNNFNELYQQYMQVNPPDVELDTFIKQHS